MYGCDEDEDDPFKPLSTCDFDDVKYYFCESYYECDSPNEEQPMVDKPNLTI